MADLRTILIGLLLVAYSTAAYEFVYPGRYPVVYLIDFSYIPTNYGYQLLYRTNDGILREEQAYLPIWELRSHSTKDDSDDSGDSGGDILGSSMKRRPKSKLPLKNRKVSPKLLSSLAG